MRDREHIRIIDNVSGKDITSVTLGQSLTETERKHAGSVSTQYLAAMVRRGVGAIQQAVKRSSTVLSSAVDFAEDEAVRTGAAMVLDVMLLDLLHNTYEGLFATTHGRTYPNKYQNGLKDSTQQAAWTGPGLGEPGPLTHFPGAFLATSPHAHPRGLHSLGRRAGRPPRAGRALRAATLRPTQAWLSPATARTCRTVAGTGAQFLRAMPLSTTMASGVVPVKVCTSQRT